MISPILALETGLTHKLQKLDLKTLIFIGLTILYVFAYELVFFFSGPDYFYIVYPIKMGTPILLLLLAATRVPLFRFIANDSKRYTVLSFCLLVTVLFPTLVNLGVTDGFLEWSKYIPRVVFFIAIVAYFSSFEVVGWWIAMSFVAVGVLTFIQYCFLVLTINAGNLEAYYIFDSTIALGGPYGVLGNINSIMYFPSFDLPVPRLTGFWLEPSNASAFLFATFFLARALISAGYARGWRICSWACFAGGLACLSNAGYLALGVAYFFPIFFVHWKKISVARRFLLFLISVPLVVLALSGREYVAQNLSDNDFARAVTGVREDPNVSDFDGFAGRLEWIPMAISSVEEHPFGVGLFATSEHPAESPSAPLKWLTMAGILGLIILICREASVFRAAVKTARTQPYCIHLSQAWLVVLVQQTSYGEWANGFYFFVVALVFSSLAWEISHAAAPPSNILSPEIMSHHELRLHPLRHQA